MIVCKVESKDLKLKTSQPVTAMGGFFSKDYMNY